MTTEAYTPLFLAAEAMSASVAVCATMFYFLYRSRKQIRALQDRLDEARKLPSIVEFLQRESAVTQRLLQQPAALGDSSRLLAMLRKRWLKAEQRALVELGGARSDMQLLQRGMATILTLLERSRQNESDLLEAPAQWALEPAQTDRSKVNSAASGTPSPDWQSSVARTDMQLRKAQGTIDTQRKTIGDLRNLVSLYRQRTQSKPGDSNASADATFDATLQVAAEHTEELQRSIGGLQRSLESMRKNYLDACAQIKALQTERKNEKPRSLSDSVVLVVERSKQMAAIESARDVIGEMDVAYQHSSGELSRLQGANQRQRELLLQMERELGLLRKDAVEQGTSQTLLDQLKLQLRDYEMCTITLEAETENLRGRLQALNRILEEAEQSGGGDIVEQMQKEINDNLRLKSVNQRQLHMLETLQRVALAIELEAAIAQLLNLLREWQLEAVLMIKQSEEQLCFSTEGATDRRDKQLLQSIAPVPDQPYMDTKDGLLLLYPCCRLLLRGEALSGTERESIEQALLSLMPAIDSVIARLVRQRQGADRVQQLQQQFKSIRKPLVSIEVQNRYLLEESARVLDSFRAELATYLNNIEATPMQHQILQDMFSDFEARMTMISNGTLASRKSLLVVMQGLDKLTTEV